MQWGPNGDQNGPLTLKNGDLWLLKLQNMAVFLKKKILFFIQIVKGFDLRKFRGAPVITQVFVEQPWLHWVC